LGLAAGGLYVLPAILGRPLTETPEARVAVVAREMLESGEWVLPRLGGEVRLNKPPWAYWQTAVAANLLRGDGPHDEAVMARAVLLPSALAAALTVAILAIMATMAWGGGAGAIAGFCFGVSWMVIRYSQMGFLDCTLMAACAIGLCGASWLATAPRPGLVSAAIFGIGLGLGLLIKGPLALVMVLPALLICGLLERSVIWRRLLLLLLGLVLAALIAVPWFLMVANRLPTGTSVWAFLSREMGSGHNQDDPYAYYVYKLAGGFAPWTLVVLLALVAILVRGVKGFRAWIDRRLTGVRFCGNVPAPFALFRFFVIATAASLLILYVSAKQQ
jgi:4-amino-4-deoxy-L-arabinose transferase-like glycosyltransferase